MPTRAWPYSKMDHVVMSGNKQQSNRQAMMNGARCSIFGNRRQFSRPAVCTLLLNYHLISAPAAAAATPPPEFTPCAPGWLIVVPFPRHCGALSLCRPSLVSRCAQRFVEACRSIVVSQPPHRLPPPFTSAPSVVNQLPHVVVLEFIPMTPA